MKKKLILWLAVLMIVASVSITAAAEETAPTEYTALAILNGGYALDETLALQTWEEMFNIHFEIESVLGADLTEKRNLVLASGEYPDIFIKANLSMTDLNRYGSQGIFQPLEDLIHEYMPNLTAVLDERDAWEYMVSSDGHIYSLPQVDTMGAAMESYWINKAWMDTLDLAEPTSFDELYEVLKAFKTGDPNGNGEADEIPLFCIDNHDQLLAYADYAYDPNTKTAVIDDVLTYIPTTEHFKEFIAYLTKLYSEGLLDANSFTQTSEQQAAIGQSGDVLGSFFGAGSFLTVGRDNDDDYIILTPFQEGTYPLITGISVGSLVVTDYCENVETLLAALDYFYSEEGGILAWMGVEGETYEIYEDGTWGWILNNGYGDDITEVRLSNTILGSTNHPSIQPDFWFTNMSPEVDPDEVYLNGERAKVVAMGVVPLPMMNYTEEENEEIATIKTDVDAYIGQYVAQVVTGAMSLEDSWDSYVSTMNNMGAERLAEIYQDVYARAIAE
ncbi:MAG TPA: extracellular solute-binding protein [Candidatus Ornithocaccomicrobium faecavium]|uniref:Extracellular solute-binding protein n=1 Tax=Candidatus Ornithocaccomicrobium faecavium TaxID=2840890 RepID=A0A9D1P9W9_9FIRM|nr:extracellular solute-binding protein [Candidatus Ornithocaccomicrobium faecavium]